MLFYDSLEDFFIGENGRLKEMSRMNIPERGIISRVLLPDRNKNRSSDVENYSVTREVDKIEIDSQGIWGERHSGREFRASTARERDTYPKGTMIRQNRHIMVVSQEDCEILGELMGVVVTPELLGANIVIGREDGKGYSLSGLPQSTYLMIGNEDSVECPNPPRAVLRYTTLQMGCGVTGNAIAAAYGDKSLTKKFSEVAKVNRGVVFSVEYPTHCAMDDHAKIMAKQKVFFKFATGVTP